MNIKCLLALIINLVIGLNVCSAQEVISEFSDKTISVLNEELRDKGVRIIDLEYDNGILTTTFGTIANGNVSDDAIMLGDGTEYKMIILPDCDGSNTSKLLYDQATNTITCGTDYYKYSGYSKNLVTGEKSRTILPVEGWREVSPQDAAEKYDSYIYVSGHTSAIVRWEGMYDSSGVTGYERVKIHLLEGTSKSMTSSYVLKSDTIDISSLTTGWYKVSVEADVDTVSRTFYVRSMHIFVE